MRGWLVAALTAVFICPSARAADRDVQTLRGWCQAAPGDGDFTRCVMYAAGISDMATMLGDIAPTTPFAVCAHPSYGASIQAFRNWADQHPEKWSANMGLGLLLALHEKWPCSPKQ